MSASASQSLGGQSHSSHVIGPSLDKIIKNAALEEALPHLAPPANPPPWPILPLHWLGLSLADAEFVLQPLILALDSAYSKIVEPALECSFKLFSRNLVHAEIGDGDGAGSGDQASAGGGRGGGGDPGLILRLLQGVCKSAGIIGEEAIELGVLRVVLATIRSPLHFDPRRLLGAYS